MIPADSGLHPTFAPLTCNFLHFLSPDHRELGRRITESNASLRRRFISDRWLGSGLVGGPFMFSQ